MNENVWILNAVWLNFVPKDSIDTNNSIGSDNGLAPNRWQAIIWINGYLVYWRIYASLSLNELKCTYCFEIWQTIW